MRAYQVAALNRGFTPTDDETASAASMIAQTAGNNGAIDASRAAIATNLIEWATACAAREQGRATMIAQTDNASN